MLDSDPLWYLDAIIYELHVRSFHDSVGDGMGNFRGLTQKLDYLEDLGVTAIWLLPFYPSPLRDDGYDIADYTRIHPDYGSLRDFRMFLEAAHRRGLRVITELVINHTSDQHPWFQRARRAPAGSSERDFYVWSERPDRYAEARIIFKDFEQSNWAWDPVAQAYYWHRFYSHQPDLNYDNPEVWKAIFPVVDFWYDLGVDGLRLDAVPYLYEREGTNCENLAETHAFLKALRRHIDEKYQGRMLLAEANQWPEDAVAYFGGGDEAHMAFHFPLMPRMFMAIHMEDRFPIIDIIDQTPTIADTCQWGLFLRNHDELTLEMVTDEERDYMYRAYANDPRARINLGIRHRLAPLLGNNRRRIELMNALLLSLRGTPVIYYGDELGMGDNIYLGDRNGVRTPMQWSADRNAGFSRANPQKLFLPIVIDPEYHYETVNVEAQQNNASSLLWWMKRIIALRKSARAFGRGSLEFLKPTNRKVLAFLRTYQDESILVVANLSRFAQSVQLELANMAGRTPVELFGRTAFPTIGSQPYPLTFGPHSFFWFALEAPRPSEVVPGPETDERVPITVEQSWEELLQAPAKAQLEDVLPAFLKKQGWFNRAGKLLKEAHLVESFRVRYDERSAYVAMVKADYADGTPEMYVLPLVFEARGAAPRPEEVIARVQGGMTGWVGDALSDASFCAALLRSIAVQEGVEGSAGGQISTVALAGLAALSLDGVPPAVQRADLSNTTVTYGNQVTLKVFRHLQEGLNPDLEISQVLTERKVFPYAPPLLGCIEYRRKRPWEPMTVAILQGFVPNEGNAWQYALDELSSFFERVLAMPSAAQPLAPMSRSIVDLADEAAPPLARELLDTYLESARLLGQRTAELHRALACETADPYFVPEPFSVHYQRSVYQSMRTHKGRIFHELQQKFPDLPDTSRAEARRVLDADAEIMRRYHSLIEQKLHVSRTRTHGEFHLGKVLHTGKDYVFLDFEGDALRSISDRRLKRCALRDVANMIRSYHYAAYAALTGKGTGRGRAPGIVRSEDFAILEPWAHFWYSWASAAFLNGYLTHTRDFQYLSPPRAELKMLLEAFLLDKAIHETGHDLRHRLDWLRIPLLGILQILEASPAMRA